MSHANGSKHLYHLRCTASVSLWHSEKCEKSRYSPLSCASCLFVSRLIERHWARHQIVANMVSASRFLSSGEIWTNGRMIFRWHVISQPQPHSRNGSIPIINNVLPHY